MENKAFGGITAILLFLIPFLAIASPVAAAAPVIGGPLVPLRVGFQSDSLNWAGYALNAAPGSIEEVYGSWKVPSVSGRSGDTYVALWVGIDGFTTNTVEQTGVLIEDLSGRVYYYAWYEFYPSSPVYAPSNDKVKPGDIIYAIVIHNSNGTYTTEIEDITQNWKWYSPATSVSGAQDANAEWIVERPATVYGLTTLANFGTAYFGQDYTSVSGTNFVTIGGTTETMQTAGAVSITMVNNAGQPLATPSGISSDGTSFTVTYVSGSTTTTSGHGGPHGGK
ncbi:G1 family endopeptidase [Tardisphaera miroshnichenkoae]